MTETKEERILRVMKQVLTRVIKETATPPHQRHPLSARCLEDMRQCLLLISAREQELAKAAGRKMDQRPRYADEPRAQGPVVVPLDQIKRKGDSTDGP